MTASRGRTALAVLLAAAAAVHAALALGTPVGGIVDDAVYLLLARALRAGDYVLPDGFARPVTSYWPGAPALWALPAWLCGGNWGWCRLAALAVAWVGLWQVWRFSRRLLRAESAAAVTVVAAFCPVFAANAGVCGSDAAFLGLSAAAFAALPDPRASRRASDAVLTACAAAAALFRPEGLLLIPALALAVGWNQGPRRAARFAALALLPALAWLARNRLLAGTASDYARQFASQAAPLADPSVLFDQAARLIGLLFGRGLLGLAWDPLALAAGLLVLAAAAAGTVLTLRARRDARVLALAAYVAAVLVLHVLWRQVLDRYLLLVLAPTLVLCALAAEERLTRGRAAAAAALALALGASADARALSGARFGAQPWPATMAYVRAQVPADGLIQSPAAPAVMLWTDRRAISTFDEVSLRDQWLAKCLNNGVGYLVLDENLTHWSRMPGPWLASISRLNRWAQSSPYAALAFRDAGEGAAVYRLSHPDPARYLRAWDEVRVAMTQSPSADAARAQLKQALALEPELASARLALSSLETGAAADADRRKALASDPTLAPAD